MTFGRRLEALRREHGQTQCQLTDHAGADVTCLMTIENDRLEPTPSLGMIQDLARVPGVDELELIELANKAPPVLGRSRATTTGGGRARQHPRRRLRRATATIRTCGVWRDLLDYPSEARSRKRRPRGKDGGDAERSQTRYARRCALSARLRPR